jgi:plasmid stabilization system protein ParE
MTYRVITEPTAEAGAREAYNWLRERSPAAATRWLRGLRQAIESLAEHPQRCPLAPENEHFEEEIRQHLYGKRPGVYRILFTIRDGRVVVLYIRHSARRALTPGLLSSESGDEDA